MHKLVNNKNKRLQIIQFDILNVLYQNIFLNRINDLLINSK